MSHQEGLIYFRLSEPALFLRGEEDFNSHSLPSPLAHPDLSVSPFSDLLHHLNLLGNGALHLETKMRTTCVFYEAISSLTTGFTNLHKIKRFHEGVCGIPVPLHLFFPCCC